MTRENYLKQIQEYPDEWDVIIIGGGATGLGALVESASRGYRTLLVEQSDFAKATSSRSTKLIHGGLRYLKQGNISLVMEALEERGLLCHNAPHLVHHQPFLVPSYRWWQGPFYGAGIKIYDMLAGKLGLEPSRWLSKAETLRKIPSLSGEDLKGGMVYYDGQFDDARLAITLMRTAQDLGGVAINYMKVTSVIKEKGICIGVKAKDIESKRSYTLRGKVVINATGIFADSIRAMDFAKAENIISPSQGIHLVLPRKFLPKDTAILVPETDDGRVLFIVPWHDRALLGTTDTAVSHPKLEPRPFKKEIKFLLDSARKYLSSAPLEKDILSIYSGHRPLIRSGGKKSSSLARDHYIEVSKSRLVTIAGGKWTTYRKMGEDVITRAALEAGLATRQSITKTLHLHGFMEKADHKDHMSVYGTEKRLIKEIEEENAKLKQRIHKDLPYTLSEVVWAVRKEMARTVDDILSRRTRALLLDAKAAIDAAPKVAHILAKELSQSEKWQEEQVKEFTKLAAHYLPTVS